MKKMLLALWLIWGIAIMPVSLHAADDEDCLCPCACEDEDQDNTEEDVEYSSNIIINEVLPNPSGAESEDEWIELKNTSSEDVDLSGWILGDGSTKTYAISEEDFDSTIIEADSYLVIYRSESSIALNNSGDEVHLYQPDENLLNSMDYSESAEEDYAYALDDNEWFWTTEPTPGEDNIIAIPEAEENEEAESSDEDEEAEEQETEYDYSDHVIISEILPDPEGSDSTDEFIEIYNDDDSKIDLLGWSLSDNSKTYTWEESTEIESKNYQAFYITDTKVSLNNSGETIVLQDPDGNIISEVTYEDVETGYSYCYVNDDYQWSIHITPDEVNIIEESTLEEDLSTSSLDTEEQDNYQAMSIAAAREQEKNTEVIIEGIVSVEPGILGTQFFYIQDNQSGIQVYSSKKYFPTGMAVGDLVKVRGKVSESANEKKINISNEDGIEIMGVNQNLEIVATEEMNENYEGLLVSTESQILDLASNKITLANDILVYIKSGVEFSKSDYEEGQIIQVVGIVGQYREDYRLMPRSSSDIEVLQENTLTSASSSEYHEPAELSSFESFLADPDNNKNIIIKYLALSITALLIALIAVIYKSGIYKQWQQKASKLWGDLRKNTKAKDAPSRCHE